MAEESKSSLQKVLEEMLARTKQYQQSPQAQVNAQMSAKDPNFAAGALVGQLLASYIGKQLQNRRDKQTIEDTNPPTTLGEEPAAGQPAPQEAAPEAQEEPVFDESMSDWYGEAPIAEDADWYEEF